MRLTCTLLWLGLSVGTSLGHVAPNGKYIALRQDSSRASAFPTLGQSSIASTSPSDTPTITSILPSSSASSVRSSSSDVPASITSVPSNSTQPSSSSISDAVTTSTSVPTFGNSTSNGTSTDPSPQVVLPLQPRITPALAISGVVLIITGVVYALVGVKNKWVQVFLSTAYLSSLSVLVLIIYVVNPPVTNAIQGAYFVGVFMTGIIFGSGALVFKDITEGLGCLLGGFSLSMWFLTLKEGGLITSTGGKAIFIAISCVLCWSLSFSHYTRAYGLIGSTSFSGATAVVLGIDCFDKAGLKEFWVYVWNLNNNLFPLNTESFPITRGIRVETIIILLGCAIGIISQIRLWKIVRDRQRAREELVAEDARRRDAVEEALGRHLERQNDRDRSEWEKRYGDRLQAKRSTVLWSETQQEKSLASTSTTEVDSSDHSESVDSLELQPISMLPKSFSRNKRQSNISVQAIPEEDEDAQTKPRSSNRDTIMSTTLGKDLRSVLDPSTELRSPFSKESLNSEVRQSLKPSTSKPPAQNTQSRMHLEPEDHRAKKRRSIPSMNDLKRLSMQSLRSITSGKNGEKSPTSPAFSASQEALVSPPSEGAHSRASSVAATMDLENEKLELPEVDTLTLQQDSRPPQIVISQVGHLQLPDRFGVGPEPSSPSALSDDADPEALVRSPEPRAHGILDFDFTPTNGIRGSGADVGGLPRSTSMISSQEGLTKGALEKVPSQLSNVVLSYRTNEWAKHIAAAETPEPEEPILEAEDAEAPAHLIDPATLQKAEPVQIEKPPELPSPTVTVAPSSSGLTVNPELQPILEAQQQQSPKLVSDVVTSAEPTPVVSPTELSPSMSQNEFTLAPVETSSRLSSLSSKRRSFTDLNQLASRPKSTRRLSNPLQRQNTIPKTIDEDQATDFTTLSRPSRSVSRASHYSQLYMPQSGSTPNLLLRADSSTSLAGSNAYSAGVMRSSNLYSTSQDRHYGMPDFTSGGQHYSPYGSQLSLRSEVRLNNPAQSHQPLSRTASYHSDAARRENMLADWRSQMYRSQSNQVMPGGGVDRGHAQMMLMEKEATRMRAEQDRYQKELQQAQFDQGMRTQGMIDAHKEALRRMQSQANQKLR